MTLPKIDKSFLNGHLAACVIMTMSVSKRNLRVPMLADHYHFNAYGFDGLGLVKLRFSHRKCVVSMAYLPDSYFGWPPKTFLCDPSPVIFVDI